MAYLNVLKVEEALSEMRLRFLHEEIMTEMVDLDVALGRYLAKDLYATENLPTFRRSSVDGYAVIASDTLGASEQSPMILKSMGAVEMGQKTEIVLSPGCAIYVPTGGEIPEDADAMVMIEYTEKLEPDIAIYDTATYGENIVGIGEDVREQMLVLKKGTCISSQHMAILASLGHFAVCVVKKPKIFILSTGDELVDVREIPKYGQVRDCNAAIIRSVVQNVGCEVVDSIRVSDRMEAFQEGLRKAASLADVVLVSGGSSAGIKDMTQVAIESLNDKDDTSNVFIHGLAIKPGKPTVVGQINGKAIIGLPGHPAACFITLKAFVEPFLNDLLGKYETRIRTVSCSSAFQLYAASGRDVYQLVELKYDENKLVANILYGKSGMVSAMAKANAYVVIKMNQEGIKVGDTLTATLL